MSSDASSNSGSALRPIVAVVLAGVLAGTVDIGAACLISGKSVPYILHVIAGGLLAARSFSGGVPTALLGLLLQELMGVIIAVIYMSALRFAPRLRPRWLIGGISYGVVVYGVMNYVVLPISAWHNSPTFKWQSFILNMAAMWLFGLIVAYFGSRVRFAGDSAPGASDEPRLAAA